MSEFKEEENALKPPSFVKEVSRKQLSFKASFKDEFKNPIVLMHKSKGKRSELQKSQRRKPKRTPKTP